MDIWDEKTICGIKVKDETCIDDSGYFITCNNCDRIIDSWGKQLTEEQTKLPF